MEINGIDIMVRSNNSDMLKDIHDNMIIIKEFAKNAEIRMKNLEESDKINKAEVQKINIKVAKNDWWSKTKTLAISLLSGICGFLVNKSIQ